VDWHPVDAMASVTSPSVASSFMRYTPKISFMMIVDNTTPITTESDMKANAAMIIEPVS